MLHLILVRHGQTDANVNHRLQGQSDGQLNAMGRQEVERLGLVLKDTQIDVIISSDMIRASDTAAAIAHYHNLPVNTTPLVREWNCGEWDGRPAEEFIKIVKNLTIPLAELRPPGGETLIEVRARASSFVKDVTERYPGKTIVVCSHGDFLRMMISVLMNKSIDEANDAYRMDNASYSDFILENGIWKTAAFNLTPSKTE
jgi:broad specificity phosphatase PhoE